VFDRRLKEESAVSRVFSRELGLLLSLSQARPRAHLSVIGALENNKSASTSLSSMFDVCSFCQSLKDYPFEHHMITFTDLQLESKPFST
jgi:hypothetical protein